MRLTTLKAARETIGGVIRIYNEQRQHNRNINRVKDVAWNRLSNSGKGLQFCYNLANLLSKVEGSAGNP